MSEAVLGPYGWANWKAFADDNQQNGAFEYVLYSDSAFVGEVVEQDIPYRVLNLVSDFVGSGEIRPQLALRVPSYLLRDALSEKNSELHEPGSFHGGWVDDELAAVLCVALNARIQSGGAWRSFNAFEDSDVRGRPQGFSFRPPTLLAPKHRDRAQLLPDLARRQVELSPVGPILRQYSRLTCTEAVAFVRAARQFQRAVWNADGDPDLAWISLVGALEALTAATEFVANPTPEEVIRLTWPRLAQALEGLAGDSRREIAKIIAPQSRAGVKVRTLVELHAPGPPTPRPAFARVDWNDLVDRVNKVYHHRSKALHDGLPIPAPMNYPPTVDDDGRPLEASVGSSTHTYDSSWPASELPMLLWTFAYVVRGVLLSWLASPQKQ